jgi:Co/Zn/Cd efflux system component
MDHPLVEWVRGAIEADGDAKIADLHVWRVGRSRYACIVSLVADRPHSPDLYRKRLSHNPALAHISIEVNNCPRGRCE